MDMGAGSVGNVGAGEKGGSDPAKDATKMTAALAEIQRNIPMQSSTRSDEAAASEAETGEARQEQIDDWIGNKLSGMPDRPEYRGGSELAAALNDESELGALSVAEQTKLIKRATEIWAEPGTFGRAYSPGKIVAIHDALAKTDDPQPRDRLADTYADVARKGIAEGKESKHLHMLAEQALIHNADGTLPILSGQEAELAKRLQEQPSDPDILLLLGSLSQAKPTPQNAELTAQLFLHPRNRQIGNGHYHGSMSNALANVITQDGQNGDRLATAGRIYNALDTEGGQQLLLNDKIPAEQRLMGLQKVASGEWRPDGIQQGWESEKVAQDFVQDGKIREKYASSPVNGSQIKGKQALYDFVGSSGAYQANNKASPIVQASSANGERSAYEGNEAVDKVVEGIRSAAGDADPTVTVLPVVYASNETGLGVFNLYKVEGGPDGTKYVDHNGRSYASFENWRRDNDLPPGRMSYSDPTAAKADAGSQALVTENTPNVVDTPIEYVRETARYSAIGLGVVGAGAFILGTGGVGGILIGKSAVAGLTAGGSELVDIHQRGSDITDLSDPRVRGAYFEAGTSLLAMGSLAAINRATQLAANGSQYANAARIGASGLVVGTEAANAGAIGDQAYNIYENWDKMTPSQRVQATGQLIFFGSLGYGVTKAAGGKVFDGFNPKAIERSIAAQAQSARAPTAEHYQNLEAAMERLGPEGARAAAGRLRRTGSAKADNILTSMIAARDTPTRQAVLREFGEDFASINLDTFRRLDGAPIAQTPDQRYALAHILAQTPKLTPQQFAFAQDMAMLANSVYPKVRTDLSLGPRETLPPHYERVTDFSRDPRLKAFSEQDFKNPETGLYSELFHNKEDGSYTLVFRGSVSGRNATSNVRQALGREDKQYQQAMRLGRRLKDELGPDFAGATGHSKGGGQAAAVSMVTETPAITFNAAGLHPQTVQRAGGAWNESRITNFWVEGEVLTYVQEDQLITSYALPSATGHQTRIRPLGVNGSFIAPGSVSGTELHKMHSVFPGMLIDLPAK